MIRIFAVTGPMCRYAEDLIPLLTSLSRPEKLEILKLSEPVDLRKLKIYYMLDNGGGYLETRVHE